jgi:RNA polymerase sigma-70 factor (ECF subfamily)
LDFDDLHLIERTQQGESDAFNPLVVKYQPRIYTFISQQVKEIETAKDLTQETWLKAFRAIKTFRGDSAFASWLYRIAENVCIDYFRKQQKAYDIEPLHTVDERHITETHPDPCRDLERQELQAYLRAAIQHLTRTRKQVFLLYYAQDLSIKQIATRLNRSEGTIKSHLGNARLQLRDSLTPYLKNQQIPWLS